MMATDDKAIFDDAIEHHTLISSSQEEILCHSAFAGPNDGSPISSAEIPVVSPGIAMASLPETAQDTAKDRGSQDVFHTPPEHQSSQSASEGHGRAIHKAAAETDDETQGFFDSSENAVDLRDDSQLGFPEGLSNHGKQRTLVAECLDVHDGARQIEICRSEVDTFRISKRELPSKDTFSEPLSKDGNDEAEEGAEEGDKIVNVIDETVTRKKGVEEQPESSAHSSPVTNFVRRVAEIKKEIKDEKNFMFDVFEALTKNNPVDDASLENVSFLELARSRGFKCPRPFWWGEDMDFQK